MALWAQAQQLPPDSLNQIKAIYDGNGFPIEVRHYLADFIEEKFFHADIDLVRGNPQHKTYLVELVESLIQEIENKASLIAPTNFVLKMRLGEAAKSFKQAYSSDPLYLYDHIKRCLLMEINLIKKAGGDYTHVPTGFDMPNSATEIFQKIDILQTRTQETKYALSKTKEEQEAFALHFHQLDKLDANVLQMQALNTPNNPRVIARVSEKDSLQRSLTQRATSVVHFRTELLDKFRTSYQLLNELQCHVMDEELMRWKREQQLAGNGMMFSNNSLETIQEWCEYLVELIWLNRQQLKELQLLQQQLNQPFEEITQLINDVTQLLSSLVTATYIVEKQPPQVLKTNTKFTSTVRLLVGGKLNVYMNPPQVDVSIISEAQANILLKNEKLCKGGNSSSGEIVNSIGVMDYQQSSRQLSINFRNMQLKKIKRAEKKGSDSVMDEKFSLLFQSQFTVGGGELTFQVWTLSLPVVVIVHGNQEPHAWATVTWDNAFSDISRIPFVVPNTVPWNIVAETLSLKFKSATGRGLTHENLMFLAEKAFRSPNPDLNQHLTWVQFCKQPLSDRNFTFWEWFYAVMKLTKDHLRHLWCDGFIEGFMRKKDAETLLAKCLNGTFLLRFSDSELGGITIAWATENQDVLMLQPFTTRDFQIRTLADRIADLHHLHCLYPNTPKNIAFGKYYTPYQEAQLNSSGYVKPLLVTHVPGINETGSVSYPNTPQPPSLQSPEHQRDTPSAGSSYTGSVSTHANSEMDDYLEPINDYNLDMNIVTELMQDYRP